MKVEDMQKTVDVFWSFRSPYSYLVTPELLRLRDDYDVDVVLRPVLPIAVRDQSLLFSAGDRKKPLYIKLDSARRAEFLGLPMVWPSPDPVVQDMTNYQVSDDQPYIYRLTALGVEAQRRGKGIDLAYHVASLIWSGTRNWDEGDKLSDAVGEAGLDLADMEASINMDDALVEIEANQQALDDADHWGVPTMVFDGEPFFGQDRIDTLRWRLDQAGLKAK